MIRIVNKIEKLSQETLDNIVLSLSGHDGNVISVVGHNEDSKPIVGVVLIKGEKVQQCLDAIEKIDSDMREENYG
ncbi:hypothetical protein [Zooshikella sp. RANM57]|uniref:hypothetical protein n=1 Tax=Zooshikella sp. RANM57 TaxID=3425863 RepID=UPI003D6E4420